MREDKPFMKHVVSALVFAASTAAVALLATGARAAVVCDAAPLTVADGCKQAQKLAISVHDDPDPAAASKDNMSWSWSSGEPMEGPELGNPVVGTTEYALCIYDGVAGVPTLVKNLQIPSSSTLWSVKSGDGFQYLDRDMANDGVLQLRLKADPSLAGRSKVKLKARGANFDPPGPPLNFPLQYFEQNPSLIVNLVNSLGTCWTSTFVPANNGEKVTGKDFKSRVP